VQLGPFPSEAEAEGVEQRVRAAGYPAERMRQPSGASVFAVLIDTTAPDVETFLRVLHEQGFAEAVVVAGADGSPVVRVGDPRALRGAVVLAERLRGLGHPVRLVSQPGEDGGFMVRHGSYASREEAGEKGEALQRLGLEARVVQVR
jgi:cell division septation protein DedD